MNKYSVLLDKYKFRDAHKIISRFNEGDGLIHEGKGLTIDELHALFKKYIIDLKEFNLQFVTSNTENITPAPRKIIIFLIDQHFTIAIYDNTSTKCIEYFDPLALPERREKDLEHLHKFSLKAQPEHQLLVKYNLNAWQSKYDTHCGVYCLLFAHNVLNLDLPYSAATEWSAKDEKLFGKINFYYI